jgi:hypothetical protein
MAGRPQADIDWSEVDRYLEAGCTGSEIAGFLGIAADTLYNRCEVDHKVNFSAYSQQKKSRGEALLRAKQYQMAMKGDRTLLVWLGKNRLGQKEPKELNDQLDPRLDKILDFLAKDASGTSQ